MEDRSHVREDAILTKKQNHENVMLDKMEQNSKNQMMRLEESKRNEREHNKLMEDKKNDHEMELKKVEQININKKVSCIRFNWSLVSIYPVSKISWGHGRRCARWE